MHRAPLTRQKPHPLSYSPTSFGNDLSLSNTSSETIEPITPIETDEHYIDRLWEQVRSKGKNSVDIPIPDEEKPKAVAEPRGIAKVHKPTESRLSRRPSLTFRDSSDGRSALAILILPGVEKSDVHVTYTHKRLIISYKSVEETEVWEHDKVVQETRERRCVREIPLPESTRPNHVRAAMADYRLVISYPKCGNCG